MVYGRELGWHFPGSECRNLIVSFVSLIAAVLPCSPGKQVWYVTHVGVFRLTREGLLLEQVMPGIDIDQDILNRSGARIRLPETRPARVPEPVVTGRGFVLEWPVNQPAGSD